MTTALDTNILNWMPLPHCPEGQLVKAHRFDAGWDIKAAKDVIIRPYRDLPFTWEDWDLIEELEKTIPDIKEERNTFRLEDGLRTRFKALVKFNQPLKEIEDRFKMFEVSVYKDETYLINLNRYSYNRFVEEQAEVLADAKQVEVVQRKKYKPILIPTGIAVQHEILRWSGLTLRSSMSKYAVSMAHSIGVADFEYVGEIFIQMYPIEGRTGFSRGERIAQLIPMEQREVHLNKVESLKDTIRGAGGFGSSGSK